LRIFFFISFLSRDVQSARVAGSFSIGPALAFSQCTAGAALFWANSRNRSTLLNTFQIQGEVNLRYSYKTSFHKTSRHETSSHKTSRHETSSHKTSRLQNVLAYKTSRLQDIHVYKMSFHHTVNTFTFINTDVYVLNSYMCIYSFMN
jgi:hypothetical protein